MDTRTTRSKCVTLTDQRLLDLWRHVGSSQALRTDHDIARFLLTKHLDGQPCGSQPDKRCAQCNSPLTLLCVQCPLPDHRTASRLSLQRNTPPIKAEEVTLTNTSLPDKSSALLFPGRSGVSESCAPFSGAAGVPRPGEKDGSKPGSAQPAVDSDMELDAACFGADDEDIDSAQNVEPPNCRRTLRKKRNTKTPQAKKLANSRRGTVKRNNSKVNALRKCDNLLKTSEETNRADCQRSSKQTVKTRLGQKRMQKSSSKKTQPKRENHSAKPGKKSSVENPTETLGSADSWDGDRKNSEVKLATAKPGPKSMKHPRTEAQTLADFMTGRYPIKMGQPGKQQVCLHYTCARCGAVFETQEEVEEHERGEGSRPCRVQNDGDVAPQSLDEESVRLLERLRDKHLLQCPDCERVFTVKTKLVEHLFADRFAVKAKQGLTCQFCGLKYRHYSTLVDHVEILSNKKSCSACQLTLVTECQFKAHTAQHTGESVKKCKYCDKYVSLKEMKTHVEQHRQENPSCLCPHCGKKFAAKGKLNAHLVVHNKDSLFTCSQCQQGFKTLSRLRNHQIHHGEKNEQCEHCGKKFYTTKTLKNHIRITHQGERFPCQTCGAKVTSQEALNLHVRRVHLKLKPYVCGVCKMSFLQPSHLRNHSRTHTGEKPYHCQYCPAKFGFLHYQRRHEMTHTGERPYRCETCGQQYRDKATYKLHRRKKHSDKLYPCPLCRQHFPIQDSLNFHLQRVHHVEPGADGAGDRSEVKVTALAGADSSETQSYSVAPLSVREVQADRDLETELIQGPVAARTQSL